MTVTPEAAGRVSSRSTSVVDIVRHAEPQPPEFKKGQLVVVCEPRHTRYDKGGKIKKRLRGQLKYIVCFKADEHEEEVGEEDLVWVDHLPEDWNPHS